MKYRKLLAVSGALALVLMILLAIFLTHPWSNLQATEMLVFTIKATDLAGKDKTTFLIGEPVRLLLRLENQSDQDVTEDFWLGYNFNRLKLFLKKGGQAFGEYVSPAMSEAKTAKTGSHMVTLKAKGGSIEASEFVSFNTLTQDFAFPQGGKYQVNAQFFYKGHQKQLTSNEIELEVIEPRGEEDKQALQFIIDKQLKAYLTAEARLISPPESKTVNDQVQLLQEFLKKFEKSTYAPYVQLALAAICQGREQELPACKP